GRSRRARGVASGGERGVWIKVSSTTVTSGLQDGNIFPLNGKTFGAAGLAIKVFQVNNYVLLTGKYLRAWPSGIDTATGKPIYATDRQTGVDGNKSVCDNVGVKTWVEENGVTAAVTG